MTLKTLTLQLTLTLVGSQALAAGTMLVSVSPGQGTSTVLLAQRGLEPAAYASDVTRVAQAMGASLAVAVEARRQNLEETLSWTLMRCATNAGVSVPELMQRRKSMSWGELVASCGLSWGSLVKDLRLRSDAAGLLPSPATADQILRSASNDPERLAKLESSEEVKP